MNNEHGWCATAIAKETSSPNAEDRTLYLFKFLEDY